jgi:dihydropyrimidine dehydrogenase (NAD+) subunit PreA
MGKNLSVSFTGLRFENPFLLASAPPTESENNIMRAFDAGWGGAVWKTLGEPIINVSSRYSAVDWKGSRMMGLNNIELMSGGEKALTAISTARRATVAELSKLAA